MVASESAGRKRYSADSNEEERESVGLYLEVIDSLIASGADVNVLDSTNTTALDRVCTSTGSVSVLSHLLQHGAKLCLHSTKTRRSNLVSCVLNGFVDATKFLVEKCSCVVDPSLVEVASARGDDVLVSYLRDRLAE